MGIWAFLIAALAGIVAIVIAFFILWKKDPIKSAFSGLVSSLIVLFGSVGSQSIEFKASMPTHDAFGFPIEVKEFVVTSTPISLWLTACISIVLLLFWFSGLIVYERNRK
ncbi:TPA: hypothetical protein ACF39K_004503 [Vibrio parahaemolyticus]|uniref:hypothetical protein n=1 Tax=Vibrio parahaemolyticus TaxID=670 RepID=UPI001A9018E4|nr:hypothetical protein [Vibrio parahaemolyticus]MBO0159963.1 hypothetical protein [Vibrio parahaemolyticus]MBO0175162.1 hypothetical protein [Vibrio parahaemolyticus]MEA5285978.1 hypothetical protein [Vibrio parahaemolyticus]HCE1578162.1 hypothetical protein [Vibrio parahaemolyticus]HCG5291660.1 hypothetical protein [Vibrio parahaemolyticus]